MAEIEPGFILIRGGRLADPGRRRAEPTDVLVKDGVIREVGPGLAAPDDARLVEAFGRPTICLSPFEPDARLATGSIRTTDRVHVLEALRWIQSEAPGLFKNVGGHAGDGDSGQDRAS